MRITLALLSLPLTLSFVQAQAVWNQLTPASSPPGLSDIVGSSDLTGMLVFGGKLANNSLSNNLWRFDPLAGATGDWVNMSPTGTLPSPRQGCGAAYDLSRGVLVIYGGRTGAGNAGINGETWEWDSGTNTWTDKTPTVPVVGVNTPPELESGILVYESAQSRCLLFGGRGNTTTAPMEVDETWTWNGTAWTKLTPATSPPARRNHAMGYDAIHGVAMVWGGIAAGAVLGDTWTWDGTNWSAVTTATTPFTNGTYNGSILNRLAYDILRDRFVLTSGVYPGGTVLTVPDTYEFDGTDWVNRGALGIGQRYVAAVAYVEAVGRTYSFGGYNFGQLSQTWDYQTNAPATFTSQAGGCAGAGAVPSLQATALPWLGDSAFVEAHGTTAGALNVLAIALGATQIPLGPYGFPGCTAEMNPLASLLMLNHPTTGLPTASISMPSSTAYLGLVIYSQAASIEPSLQLAMSGRGDLRVGAR
ncbi:MAG: hypothetical protein KDC98_19050 [Planctomycetes bacterium]|nr:hypothetical protein [Planctomycetota bacterium]